MYFRLCAIMLLYMKLLMCCYMCMRLFMWCHMLNYFFMCLLMFIHCVFCIWCRMVPNEISLFFKNGFIYFCCFFPLIFSINLISIFIQRTLDSSVCTLCSGVVCLSGQVCPVQRLPATTLTRRGMLVHADFSDWMCHWSEHCLQVCTSGMIIIHGCMLTFETLDNEDKWREL